MPTYTLIFAARVFVTVHHCPPGLYQVAGDNGLVAVGRPCLFLSLTICKLTVHWVLSLAVFVHPNNAALCTHLHDTVFTGTLRGGLRCLTYLLL